MTIYIDISNYVLTRAHTGIQRVIREFLFRIFQQNTQINFQLIYYNDTSHQFVIIDPIEAIEFLNNAKTFEFKKVSNTLNIEEIKKNSIFFDMDSVWNNELKRITLYKKLKKNEVKIFNFIYDLVPIVKPHFSHKNTVRNFLTYLYGVYQYSDMVFFDSRSAENDFIKIKQEIKNKRSISTRVVKLGADISSSSIEKKECKLNFLLDKKYILFVGTLEPRKNQALVLDVFEKLSQKHDDLNLLLIGKPGWNNDNFIKRINQHSLKNKKLFWLNDVNDNELNLFYKHAYLTSYISEYEGFGLPVMESLAYGNITISSKNSSIYEVGKDYADYLIYNSFNELYETIELYLNDNDLYTKKKDFIQQYFKPYSWDTMYTSLLNIFNNYKKKIELKKPKSLQFVFISIDIENLKGTITAIDKHINFVNEYIIVTRPDMVKDFNKLSSKYKIHIIDENKILGKYSKDFSNRDHVSKNWLLRTSLLNIDILNDQFIMLDDDNRPIRDISINHFIENNKYNAYYFYDLLNWHHYTSEYDFGQHNMKKILDKSAYELLSYSSHKPQIIDKRIFQEVVNQYFETGLSTPIDEWSIYFNYAISKYPYLFNKKKFDVLSWPEKQSNWNFQYIPEEYNFENFYSSVYKEGVFKNLNPLTLDNKLKIKQKELFPYEKTKSYNKSLITYYQNENIVHGVLKFIQNEKSLYFYSLPYYMEVAQGSWLKIPLNYKVSNLIDTEKIQILYYINGKRGHASKVYINQNDYFESIVHFAISATSLSVGLYNLIIDVVIDEKSIYGDKSPYMCKLLVKSSESLKGKK